MENKELSIIIPCYNGESTILSVTKEIIKNISSLNNSFEIIIVDDASTDNTLNILKEMKHDLGIIYHTYAQNMGKGYAVRKGIENSTGKFVLFTDADSDISPNSIYKFIKSLEDYDVAIASKIHADSIIDCTNSRKFLSNLFGLLARFLTNLKIKDSQVGFKIGNGDYMRKIFAIMTIDRYAFDVEFLVIAQLLGLKIIELPIEMSLKRHFHLKDSFQMLIDLVKISYNIKIKKHYQKNLL